MDNCPVDAHSLREIRTNSHELRENQQVDGSDEENARTARRRFELFPENVQDHAALCQCTALQEGKKQIMIEFTY